MPPANGFYLIFHPATSSYVGVSDDNERVVGYNSPDKAQVWEIRSSGVIFTTLRNGQTGGITYQLEYHGNGTSYYLKINSSGRVWSFTPLGAHMWIMSDSPGSNWSITATTIGGLLPQNATVNYSLSPTAAGSNWWFLPHSAGQSPQLAQIFPPTIVGESFAVSSSTIRTITQDMLTTFKEGLQSKQIPLPSMIPSHVTLVPNGTEKGSFLALTITDKLTVSYFELDGDSDTEMSQQKSFSLTPQQLALEATALFQYIADCVKKAVVDDWHLPMSNEAPLYMGIVFPFPVKKEALNKGTLLRWTKEVSPGTTAGGTIGEDVVQLLQNALGQNLHIKCNALINDTTAILLAQAYESLGCEIGAIFDAGTNGAYIEEAANIISLERTSGQMVVNTEWGSFEKSQSLQRTPFDYRIDRESAYPGQQIFEKLVSTEAVGELTRLVLLHYIDTGISPSPPQQRPLFNRRSSTTLNKKDAINIDLMWEIDNAKDGAAVQQLLVKKLDLPPEHVNADDGKAVKGICRAILLRTARLSACALAATLILMGRAALGGGVVQGGLIGINGSLTRSAAFRRDMEEALREIIGADVTKNVLIVQVKRDRTSLGAAVCACMAEAMNSI